MAKGHRTGNFHLAYLPFATTPSVLNNPSWAPTRLWHARRVGLLLASVGSSRAGPPAASLRYLIHYEANYRFLYHTDIESSLSDPPGSWQGSFRLAAVVSREGHPSSPGPATRAAWPARAHARPRSPRDPRPLGPAAPLLPRSRPKACPLPGQLQASLDLMYGQTQVLGARPLC